MARITLDIPKEKVQLFLLLVVQLGIDATTEIKSQMTNNSNQSNPQYVAYNLPQQNHPYYDWDFYNNQLEFE